MSTHHKRLLVAPLCVVVPYLLFLHHKKQSRFNRDDYINDGNNDYFREDDETMKFQASRSSSSSSKLKAVQAQKADKKKTLSMPSTATTTTTTTYPSSVDDNSVPFFPWEPQLNQFQKNMNDENRVEKVIMKFESATRSKESNDKDNHSQTSNQLEFISSMTFAIGNLRKPSCPCCQWRVAATIFTI